MSIKQTPGCTRQREQPVQRSWGEIMPGLFGEQNGASLRLLAFPVVRITVLQPLYCHSKGHMRLRIMPVNCLFACLHIKSVQYWWELCSLCGFTDEIFWGSRNLYFHGFHSSCLCCVSWPHWLSLLVIPYEWIRNKGAFLVAQSVKKSVCSVGDLCSIPGLETSPGGGHSSLL